MRSSYEHQIKELRRQVEGVNGSVSEALKAKNAAYEAKIHAYEEQLDNEIRYIKMKIYFLLELFFIYVEKNKKLIEIFVYLKNVFVKD